MASSLSLPISICSNLVTGVDRNWLVLDMLDVTLGFRLNAGSEIWGGGPPGTKMSLCGSSCFECFGGTAGENMSLCGSSGKLESSPEEYLTGAVGCEYSGTGSIRSALL